MKEAGTHAHAIPAQTIKNTMKHEDTEDDKEQHQERKRRAQNIVIRGLPKKPQETPLSLAKEVTVFFTYYFATLDVNVFGVCRLGKKQGDGYKRAIVCTIMDTRKRDIVLDCSQCILKVASFI